jgi:hypothetical protein
VRVVWCGVWWCRNHGVLCFGRAEGSRSCVVVAISSLCAVVLPGLLPAPSILNPQLIICKTIDQKKTGSEQNIIKHFITIFPTVFWNID